jgi:hypothetical protein
MVKQKKVKKSQGSNIQKVQERNMEKGRKQIKAQKKKRKGKMGK